MDNIYKNIEEHNAKRKCKILIIFDNILSNKKLNRLVTELYISLVFITQSYFAVLKYVRLNSTHYFIMKNLNKQELQKITFNYSSDIYYRDFMKVYSKLYSFLVIDGAPAEIIIQVLERIFQKECKS